MSDASAQLPGATGRPTVVTFLLDETGSMQSIKDDTIGGFNAYLETLKDESAGPVFFSLLKFDSNRVEKVCVGEPIQTVAPLTDDTYRPGAMTPLIDACVKAIQATEKAVAERSDAPNIIVVFQTDGQENASTEYRREDLARLVKAKTAEGWQFAFLGAGIDAYAEAGAMGIAAASTMSYGRGNSKAAFAAMGANTRAYRTGAAPSMGFSLAQKADAGDAYDPAAKGGDATASSGPTAAKPAPAAVTARPRRKRKPIVDDIAL